jgi:hypothetical protein
MRESAKIAAALEMKPKWRRNMKTLSVWLGILILAGGMAIPAFAAQRQNCCEAPRAGCLEQAKAETSQMRSQQESFPWETPGGKVQGRTGTSLAE